MIHSIRVVLTSCAKGVIQLNCYTASRDAEAVKGRPTPEFLMDPPCCTCTTGRIHVQCTSTTDGKIVKVINV
jgi:hypothetical protein